MLNLKELIVSDYLYNLGRYNVLQDNSIPKENMEGYRLR
jgi:hypothetical protein